MDYYRSITLFKNTLLQFIYKLNIFFTKWNKPLSLMQRLHFKELGT